MKHLERVQRAKYPYIAAYLFTVPAGFAGRVYVAAASKARNAARVRQQKDKDGTIVTSITWRISN